MSCTCPTTIYMLQQSTIMYVITNTCTELSAPLLDSTKLQQSGCSKPQCYTTSPLWQWSFTEQGLYNTAITVAQLVKCKQVEKQTKNYQTCVVDEKLPRWTSKTPKYWMCVHHNIFAFGLTLTSRKCWFYIHIINFNFYWFFQISYAWLADLLHIINTVKLSLGLCMWNLYFQIYVVVVPCIWFMKCLLHFGQFVS